VSGFSYRVVVDYDPEQATPTHDTKGGGSGGMLILC
jgi:hypothetical protein